MTELTKLASKALLPDNQPEEYITDANTIAHAGELVTHRNGLSEEILLEPSLSYAKKLPHPSLVYVVDFFAGCGGMSWGFANTRQSHRAFKVLGGIDVDPRALETYRRNIAAPGIEQDVRSIVENPERLGELIPELNSTMCRPLVFIGCPPCQGFSAHRKKDDRDDQRNNLLLAFAKICSHYKPDFVVMENVPEILTGRFQSYFSDAADELRKSGYALSMDILDLSLFGVPQRRRRAIVLGALSGSIPLPHPIFNQENAPTTRHAISHLAELQAGETDPYDPNHKAPAHTNRILERIRKTPPDGGDRRSLPEDDQLDCHIQLDNSTTPGFTDVYGRLRWDTPSVTITAKSSTPSCGRFLHPEQHRNISVREAAILQGFPQSFVFEGPFVHQYRQIGEAVPPLFARFLAWQILDSLSPHSRRASTLFASPHERSEEGPSQTDATRIKVVDAFSGAGGIALGFMAAGFETAYAFDIDADSVATFAHNVSSTVTQANVCDPQVPKQIDIAVGESPFVIVGGPPCQGFSQQRRGDDSDPRNNLVLHYASLVASLVRRPMAVVLENVTYLDSPRGKHVLREYVAQIKRMGYEVFRHDLNSADYGVPQLRRRIILVGLRNDIAQQYVGPIPFTPSRWPTVGEALIGLPDPAERSLFQAATSNHVVSREGPINRRRIAYVDMSGGRKAIPPYLQLDCHTKYNGHLDVYGRLDWFSQARTITGGFDSFTRGEFAHPFHHRSITPREAARIQGFPDWFVFFGNRASLRRQIGNAVPPLLAYAIGEAIATTLSRTESSDTWASYYKRSHSIATR